VSHPRAGRSKPLAGLRTAGVLLLLLLALPFNLLLTVTALVRSLFLKRSRPAGAEPKTVLISGGKMTKALQLARSFHAAGHRVVLAESAKYRLTGHRFSRAVDRFYALPRPESPDYAGTLEAIVRAEAVRNVGIEELAEKLAEHRAHIEAQGTLSERRRRNLMSEVLAIATNRMRRELEQAIANDDQVRELLDRVVSRELDPASAAATLRPAIRRSGTISASGTSTKARSNRRGCGSVSSGLSIETSS